MFIYHLTSHWNTFITHHCSSKRQLWMKSDRCTLPHRYTMNYVVAQATTPKNKITSNIHILSRTSRRPPHFLPTVIYTPSATDQNAEYDSNSPNSTSSWQAMQPKWALVVLVLLQAGLLSPRELDPMRHHRRQQPQRSQARNCIKRKREREKGKGKSAR